MRIYLVKERKGNGPDWDAGYVDHVLDVNFTNEDSCTDKTDSDVSNRLFPIPQSVMDDASGLDGFLQQNQGY